MRGFTYDTFSLFSDTEVAFLCGNFGCRIFYVFKKIIILIKE